jgi:hypothetical protein
MLELPSLVEEVARQLHRDGYRYSEAFPLGRWRSRSWPENRQFYELVDGCLKILRALESYSEK